MVVENPAVTMRSDGWLNFDTCAPRARSLTAMRHADRGRTLGWIPWVGIARRERRRLTAALPLPGPDGPSKLTFRPSRLVRGTSRASRKVRQRQIRYAKGAL